MTANIKYAHLEGDAVRLTDHEAWVFVNGEWQPLNSADANHKASLLSAEEFNKAFPQLPKLPNTAFAPA